MNTPSTFPFRAFLAYGACLPLWLLAIETARPESMPEGDPPSAVESPSPHRPLHHWMTRLHRIDPEEHARLERLREEDPDLFRDALRERVAELRDERRGRAGPEVPERRRRPGSRRGEAPAFPASDPFAERIESVETRLAALAEHYRESEENRAAVQTEIRATLEDWLDLKQEQTAWRIQHAEAQIERLRRALQAGRERREAILDRRMNRLLREAEE